MDWTTLLKRLAEPFAPTDVQYRAGALSRDKTQARALAYAEVRVYEDRLNDVCPGEWSVAFEPWGERRLICKLTIRNVTRASTGEEGDSPNGIAGTAAEAQAFKRACSRFGLGRYLYDLPTPWVPYDSSRKQLVEVPPYPLFLSRPRACALHQALAKLGFANGAHYELAGRVAGRRIPTFTLLTEAEAKQLYALAKREAKAGHEHRKVSDKEAESVLN